MTWKWDIEGLGTEEQTLKVIDPSGNVVSTTTSDGFSWENERPQFVYNTVVDHDVQAALKEDIERID